MSIKWRKEDIEKFIFCVQQHSCLYSLKSLAYLDETLKEQTFNEILAQMRECIPNISVVDLKKKLRNLRTQFLREHHSKKSASERSDVYVPKLWCYDQLAFLENHVAIRPSKDKMEASNVPSSTSGRITKQRIVDEKRKDGVETMLLDRENTSSNLYEDDSSLLEKLPMKRAEKVVINQKIKMSTKWRREDIEKFISCVQQHSCLYSTNPLENLGWTLKAQAFNEILEQMQECIPNISVVDLKKKLRNLRTQFLHEQRMVNHSKECGRSDVYVPKLWCYDQLFFLKNDVAIRASEDSMEASNVPSTSGRIAKQRIVDERRTDEVGTTLMDCENTSSSFCEDFNVFEKPLRKRAKNVDQMEFLQKIESFQNCVLSQRKTPKKFEWLGNLVTAQMDEIDPGDQPDAAWKVQCLMRELTNNAARKPNTSASSSASCKNNLELSMAGVFDEPDYE